MNWLSTAGVWGAIGIAIGAFGAHGLPIGLQLQGPAFAEERLLQAAHLFQQATDWHTRAPAGFN